MAKLSLAGITTFTPPCNPSSSFSLSADARARASSTNWTVEEPPLTISRTACSDVVLLCLVRWLARWLACSLPTLGLGTGASVMGCTSGREISRCTCLYMLVSSTCMCICCYAYMLVIKPGLLFLCVGGTGDLAEVTVWQGWSGGLALLGSAGHRSLWIKWPQWKALSRTARWRYM